LNGFRRTPRPLIRVCLSHWAVYVGEGHVIHLAHPVTEHALAGANSKMSVLHERATVKKGKLYVVVGNNDYHINNILDDKYEPRPIQEIVQDAHSLLGKELPYSVLTRHTDGAEIRKTTVLSGTVEIIQYASMPTSTVTELSYS
uniref:Retinoic acid receptor responder 3 n=1 Tax=Sinocyclocheilus grahami TaxID=75366 RepID=A0A672SSJ4_SINGR